MKKFKGLMLLAGVTLALISCKNDNLSTYDGNSNIYFSIKKWPSPAVGYKFDMPYQGRTYTYNSNIQIVSATDSLVSSFATKVGMQTDTILVPVSMMGRFSSQDRAIGYKILPTSGAAQEGVDFHILTATIPANTGTGGFLIVLERKNLQVNGPGMTIDMELVPNENFSTDMSTVLRSTVSDEQVSTLTFRVRFNDRFETPIRWLNMSLYLGAFGRNKLNIMVNILGIPYDYIYSSTPALAYMASYGGMLKRYLLAQEAANNIQYDDDGVTKMTAGPMAP